MWINRMGFGEPSLANQTAQALRDLGDLAEAERQFKRSIATRDGAGHPRIHALTLTYLADVQFTRNRLAEACKNWSAALDVIAGLQSARADRADRAVRDMRRSLSTLGPRMPALARQLDKRTSSGMAIASEAV